MKLENQVCSLELAKKLKELGVKQESIWYHRGISNNTNPDPEKWYYSWGIVLSNEKVGEPFNNARLRNYSAFTVAELINLLQTVAEKDIIIALSNNNVADNLAKQLISHYAQESKV